MRDPPTLGALGHAIRSSSSTRPRPPSSSLVRSRCDACPPSSARRKTQLAHRRQADGRVASGRARTVTWEGAQATRPRDPPSKPSSIKRWLKRFEAINVERVAAPGIPANKIFNFRNDLKLLTGRHVAFSNKTGLHAARIHCLQDHLAARPPPQGALPAPTHAACRAVHSAHLATRLGASPE